METKICLKCNEVKDITDFTIYNKTKGLRINCCLLCKKKYNKKYNEITSDIRSEQKKEYREKNSVLVKQLKKRYYNENKEKIREYQRKWERGKRETDVMFKLKQNVRGRIYKFVVSLNGKVPKKSKTFDIIGCSPEFLKEHLEKQFTEGMSWDLMGQYIHIDHIIPLSSANNEEDMYKLCHYTNLQPLWWFDNLSKGSKVDGYKNWGLPFVVR